MGDFAFSGRVLCTGHLTEGEEVKVKEGLSLDFQRKKHYYYVLHCVERHSFALTCYKDRKQTVNGKPLYFHIYSAEVKVHRLMMSQGSRGEYDDFMVVIHAGRPQYFKSHSRSELRKWYRAFQCVASLVVQHRAKNVEHHARRNLSSEPGVRRRDASPRPFTGSAGQNYTLPNRPNVTVDKNRLLVPGTGEMKRYPSDSSFSPDLTHIQISDDPDGDSSSNFVEPEDLPPPPPELLPDVITFDPSFDEANTSDTSSDDHKGQPEDVRPEETPSKHQRKKSVLRKNRGGTYDVLEPPIEIDAQSLESEEYLIPLPSPGDPKDRPNPSVTRRRVKSDSTEPRSEESPETPQESRAQRRNRPFSFVEEGRGIARHGDRRTEGHTTVPASWNRNGRERPSVIPRRPGEAEPSRNREGEAVSQSHPGGHPRQMEHIYAEPDDPRQLSEMLKREQSKSYVSADFERDDVIRGVIFVELLGKVWVAGWDSNYNDRARFQEKLHVGDMLLQINEQNVKDLKTVDFYIKSTARKTISLVLQRLPYGRVIYMTKRTRQSWNCEVKKNKIKEVRDGPALRAGVTEFTKGPFKSKCKWIITELQHQPIRLLNCEKNEVRACLMMQNEIALVLQPKDFIQELMKQLKKKAGKQIANINV